MRAAGKQHGPVSNKTIIWHRIGKEALYAEEVHFSYWCGYRSNPVVIMKLSQEVQSVSGFRLVSLTFSAIVNPRCVRKTRIISAFLLDEECCNFSVR